VDRFPREGSNGKAPIPRYRPGRKVVVWTFAPPNRDQLSIQNSCRIPGWAPAFAGVTRWAGRDGAPKLGVMPAKAGTQPEITQPKSMLQSSSLPQRGEGSGAWRVSALAKLGGGITPPPFTIHYSQCTPPLANQRTRAMLPRMNAAVLFGIIVSVLGIFFRPTKLIARGGMGLILGAALLVATMMALFLSVKDMGTPPDPDSDDTSSTLASGLSPDNVNAIEKALGR
jgi:hypothetical protein